MKLKVPDTAQIKSNKSKMQIILKAPDNESKWIIIDFNKDQGLNLMSGDISPPILPLYRPWH